MKNKKKKRVVFTRRIPGGAIEELSEKYDVRVGNVGVTPRDKLLKLVKGADAIVSVITEKIDGEVMDAAGEQLKVVANYAVGFDNIGLEAAERREVYVTNTPSDLGDAVAEFAIALMLAVSRRVVDADDFMRAGRYAGWDPSGFLGRDLSGKIIGVVGVGRIGSAIARRAHAVFEMEVLYNQHHKNKELEKDVGAKMVELEELLEKSDVVAMAVPLTDETYHMIGRDEFLKMKKSAIFINVSRGKVVSEKGLIWALNHDVIWGAGLDVFEDERNIGLDWVHRRRLLRQKDVVLTPHIASATIDAREEMAEMVVEVVKDVLVGKKPKYLVEKDK